MAREIERKFLVTDRSYRSLARGNYYKQGYFNCMGAGVRVRIADNKAHLNIKGPTKGNERAEFEYEIPMNDAEYMMEHLVQWPLIEKHRYIIDYKGFTWEVDEFHGENEGLVVAEIELDKTGQQFPKPPWIGKEVTEDPRYYNANLFKNPYSGWTDR
ncbi:MAG: CYTH domain-containing protein [Bacteroidales bacterium]|nr:CYTH domain-containing protein [Bacteroidales bacterium]